MSFSLNAYEQLHDSRSRFESIIRKCPHCDIFHWKLARYFYGGMDYQNKQIIDAFCKGPIASKSEDQAHKILEELSQR